MTLCDVMMLAGCALAGCPPITASVNNSNSGEYAISLNGLADMNGDGVVDYIVGHPGLNAPGVPGAGGAFVRSGAGGTILRVFYGESSGSVFGRSVCSAGDINSDGVDDILVGAEMFNGAGGVRCGRAYVFSGSQGTLLMVCDGHAQDERLGRCATGLGDVNGDGHDDFAIGAPGPSVKGPSEIGKVYVYSGADGSVIYYLQGEQIVSEFGTCIANIGDVNGDRVADLAVGARWFRVSTDLPEGKLYVFDGSTGRLLWQQVGVPYEELGTAVAGIGDVDGDNSPDIAVSGPIFPAPGGMEGRVSAYSGLNGRMIWSVFGTSPFDTTFGSSLAGVGDATGDGVPDVLVGDYSACTQTACGGRAYLVSGHEGTFVADWGGQSDLAFFGFCVARLGDVNGDGLQDVLVGAPNQEVPFAYSGKAYILAGRPSGDLNCDGLVGIGDLLIVLAEWGRCAVAGCAGDCNLDGSVNVGDLLTIINHWTLD